MKKIAALLLALALLAALPACGSGSAPAATPSADPLEEARLELHHARENYGYAAEELRLAVEDARALLDAGKDDEPGLVELLENDLSDAEQALEAPEPSAPEDSGAEIQALAQAVREETDYLRKLESNIRYDMELLASDREARALQGLTAQPVLTGTAETANGYKAEYTISVTRWFQASDAETLQSAWEGVGGKDGYPAVSRFHASTNDGFSEANAAIAFGTVAFRNTTEGFNFTEENPISFTVPLSVAIDQKYGINSPQIYIQYSEPKTLSFKDSVSFVPLMKKNNWGPVPFMLIVPNAFTPNDPEGAVLETLEFSAWYGGQSFTIAPSW